MVSTRNKNATNLLPMSTRPVIPSTTALDMTDEEKMKKQELARKEERAIKNAAYMELMAIRQSNGGNTKYGDIQEIIRMYNKLGYHYITAGVLNYMVVAGKIKDKIHPPAIISEVCTSPGASQSSSLTFSGTDETNNSFFVPGFNDTHSCSLADTEAVIIDEVESIIIAGNKRNPGGRPKGTSSEDRLALKLSKQKALNEASQLFADAKKRVQEIDNGKKQVEDNALKNIIEVVAKKFNLPSSKLNLHTITSRVKRNNIAGTTPQSLSPLMEIEPVIISYCTKLADMGSPLDRTQLLLLANSLIKGTDLEKK